MNNIKIYRSASQTITVKDLVGAFNKEMAPIDVFSLWNFAKSRWQLCSGLVWRRHHLNADNCSSGWRRLFVWFISSSAQLTPLQLLARELSQYNSISRSVPAFQHTPQLPSEKIRWPWRKKYLYFLTTVPITSNTLERCLQKKLWFILSSCRLTRDWADIRVMRRWEYLVVAGL